MTNIYTKLSSIGLRVVGEQSDSKLYDIEQTLLEALYEVDKDSRLLSLIFSWASVHGEYILADKFFKYYEDNRKLLVECPWVNALCAFLVSRKIHKFKKGLKKFDNEVWVGGRKIPSALKMDGAIEYLRELNIMVPRSHLRIRESDALSAKELINKNSQYKNRYIYGANWRAEIITAIERGLENPYRISKELNIGYSRVWTVFKEYKLIHDLG